MLYKQSIVIINGLSYSSRHISISAIDYAKNNGITLLSFPPHCTHKMPPLDVSIFGPFKSAIKTAFKNRLTTFPGKPIDIYQIAELSKIPFYRAFSIENIQSAFLKTGIMAIK